MSEEIDRSEDLVDVKRVRQAAMRNQPAGTSGAVASADDWHLVGLLRSGNESAFVSLIDSYYSSMLSLDVSEEPATTETKQKLLQVFYQLKHE